MFPENLGHASSFSVYLSFFSLFYYKGNGFTSFYLHIKNNNIIIILMTTIIITIIIVLIIIIIIIIIIVIIM